jgi:uncharacterized membrane protein YvbJ
MILCPMCGNFTDSKNCDVCGIKLFNDDSEKDPQDNEVKSYRDESRYHFHNFPFSGDPPERHKQA